MEIADNIEILSCINSEGGMISVTRRSEEIRMGELASRCRLEGDGSGGYATVFEFVVPAGAKVPAPQSHDRYEETIDGLKGVLTRTLHARQTDVGPRALPCI